MYNYSRKNLCTLWFRYGRFNKHIVTVAAQHLPSAHRAAFTVTAPMMNAADHCSAVPHRSP
jgi:hypothetical protein